jgi:hypothetical protein
MAKVVRFSQNAGMFVRFGWNDIQKEIGRCTDAEF